MQERQNTSTLGDDIMLLLHIPLRSNSINKLAIMASSLQLLVNYKIPIQNNNQQSWEPSTDT